MNIKYDKQADAKYIQVSQKEVKSTQKVKEWLLVDLDESGDVVGVEVLNASDHAFSFTLVNPEGEEEEKKRFEYNAANSAPLSGEESVTDYSDDKAQRLSLLS